MTDDDESRKAARRHRLLGMMKRNGWLQADAQRLFNMIDKNEPPPSAPGKPPTERKD